jgi:hypothetical protein
MVTFGVRGSSQDKKKKNTQSTATSHTGGPAGINYETILGVVYGTK